MVTWCACRGDLNQASGSGRTYVDVGVDVEMHADVGVLIDEAIMRLSSESN